MLEQLPLSEVTAACQEHTERFRRGLISDAGFCLELWRRAIDLHNPEAWRAVIEQYRSVVRERLRRAFHADETVEEIVQQTFVNLWLKSRSGAFSTKGRSLPEVLRYLLNSARYALIVVQRQREEISLTEDASLEAGVALDSTSSIEHRVDAQVLLDHLRAELSSNEWLVCQLRYADDLPPREIAVVLGSSVEQVYILLADVKRRLRNRLDLRRLLD